MNDRFIPNLLDALAVGTTLGVIAKVLTAWAALWTILWLTIRMYESRTFARFRDWLSGKEDMKNYDHKKDT